MQSLSKASSDFFQHFTMALMNIYNKPMLQFRNLKIEANKLQRHQRQIPIYFFQRPCLVLYYIARYCKSKWIYSFCSTNAVLWQSTVKSLKQRYTIQFFSKPIFHIHIYIQIQTKRECFKFNFTTLVVRIIFKVFNSISVFKL